MEATQSRAFDDVSVAARARAVVDLRLLESETEEEFDQVVHLAAEICGTPVGLITVLHEDRQIHKARFGTTISELPLALGVCRFTIQQRDVLVVPDAAADPRFVDNPLVHQAPGYRFYAGVPLVIGLDIAIGTLCVLDTQPRTLSAAQLRALSVLSSQISAQLQLRAHTNTITTLALELQSERELFRSFLDSMPVEAYLKSSTGEMLFYNQRVAERFGLHHGELLGKSGAELWPADEAALIHCEEQLVLLSNQPYETYTERFAPDGTKTVWKQMQTPLRRANGDILLANVGIDLTAELRREAALQRSQDELEEANRQLRSLALTDDLTGLWNRRAVDSQLESAITRAHRQGAPLALLMIDVDDFKQLNDEHGHSHGDVVLKQLAAVLQRMVRENDIAARFGGEEFVVVLPGSSLEGAKALCHRLAEELKHTGWKHRAITVSIGVAMCLPGTSAVHLLSMADDAMYRAKRQGKNCVVAYDAAHAGSSERETASPPSSSS